MADGKHARSFRITNSVFQPAALVDVVCATLSDTAEGVWFRCRADGIEFRVIESSPSINWPLLPRILGTRLEDSSADGSEWYRAI